ncbi:polysaccharide biosynthesis tyrosine autokinase [Solimonas sp. SE-A11]|uniref:polysaccharide biosynthesis tyrosine autokinase n=1 Tax=Solimonas sp. SE-A11 TaxID=3054954 RepID=UPI00259CBC53|nr:polysaccharide biosynthesis tyrosine autokinase [Solimonas sp. SE-A11]MDM4769732.1 polysaccharide biosynthesis tyrosine autokinase [Solimonas sp. SE-A11]
MQESLARTENAGASAEGTLGPRELISMVFGNWPMLLLFVVIGLLAAAAALYVARPMYSTESVVLFEAKSNSLELAYGEAGNGFFNSTQTLAEIEIIRSQVVLARVIRDLSLDIAVTPRYFPVIGEAVARRNGIIGQFAVRVPGLRRYVWHSTKVKVASLHVPPAYEGRLFTVQAMEPGTFNLFLDDTLLASGAKVGAPLSVKLAGDSDSAQIVVTQLDAPRGSQFSVVRQKPSTAVRGLRSMLEVEEAVRGSGVIRIGAKSPSRERSAQLANAVANAYLRQNVERRSAEAAQTLAFLKSQLPGVRQKMEASEGELNAYRLRNSSADLDRETEMVLTQSADVERARNEAKQRREELLLSVTAAHPSIKALDLQLGQLAEQSGRVQKNIAKLPETQQELLRLRREMEVNTSLYTTMLNNMQQLEVAEAGTLGNVRVIDEAAVPGGPFSPKPMVMLSGGLVGGLALGLLILLLRRLMDHAEHDPNVIEQVAGVPVYATIPYSREQDRLEVSRKRGVDAVGSKLLVTAEPRDPASESVRSLRTTLHFSLFEAKHKSVLFTGPSPGIGKSFVTSNLAAVLAQMPMKVILIDADLRRGTIHEYYGLMRNKGVTNYVLGASLEEVVQDAGVPGLSVISTGDVPPNPSELLMSPRFAQLIAEAENAADLVIIDTGPILAVTDASIIGRIAGATLLVIKAGQHTRREIQETVKRLIQVGVPVRGLVINQVGHRSGSYGYYGGYYGKYGKYGYYYSYNYGNKKK